jgi:hypothetical protein
MYSAGRIIKLKIPCLTLQIYYDAPLSDHTAHKFTSSLELFSCTISGEKGILYTSQVLPTTDVFMFPQLQGNAVH